MRPKPMVATYSDLGKASKFNDLVYNSLKDRTVLTEKQKKARAKSKQARKNRKS